VEMSIAGEKFFQRLMKFSHPHVHIYKLSHMDATSQSLVHADVTDPRHSIFLPLCKVLPTGSPNTVMLEGHHLDGSITFKFANARDQSQFLSIARKSSDIYSMVNDAYQDVRFLSAGGSVQKCPSASAALPNICGVGLFIDYSRNGKSLTVCDIVQGSPAAACGLIDVHDHVLKINKLSVKHSFSTIEDVVNSIRGIEGTTVTLEFRKSCGPSAKSTYEVSLKRAPNVTTQESCSISQSENTNLESEKDASSLDDAAIKPFLSKEDNVNLQHPKDSFGTVSIGSESPSKKEVFRPEHSFDDSVREFSQRTPKLSDVQEKLSRYLQALSSAKVVGSGSTHVFQRPILEGFTTDLGMILLPTHDHRYEVRSIVANTPSYKRNIVIGDLLWAINREPVAFKTEEQVRKLLACPSTFCSFLLCFCPSLNLSFAY
jgi:hypothetical protein